MAATMNDEVRTRARSFGAVAEAYDKGHPGYPADAVSWLVGDQPRTVLELGAGTGKLTEELVRQGHDVHATDPDPEMLRMLRQRCPDVRTSIATAEAVPVPDRSVDVVVAAQAFHWFDPEQALPEIARVLRPGGRLALVWNESDERIPWVRRLGRILGGSEGPPEESLAALVRSPLFGFLHETTFGSWQTVDRVSIVDLVVSRSHVATMGDAERDATVADVLALYDDYGRGMDGMRLPYVVRCFRASPVPRSAVAAGDDGPSTPDEPTPGPPEGGPVPPPADGDTGEMLLIDFR
jgi:ubiquinone/menaquinone biosynthesis C-methylase UbiE